MIEGMGEMKKLISIILISLFIINMSALAVLANGDNDTIETKVFRGYFENIDYTNPSLFLQTGEQTKATTSIKELAGKVDTNINDLEVVKDIFHVVHNAADVVSEGEKFSLTADQILKRGFTGCTDFGLVYAAVARELGIPTVFVQTARVDWIDDYLKQNKNMNSIRGHIFVELYINSKWYLVDSTNGKLFLDYDRNNPALPDGYYVFAKSIEVFDAGIKNEQHNSFIMKDLFSNFNINEYTSKAQLLNYYDLFRDLKTTRKSYEFVWDSDGNSSDSRTAGLLVAGQQKPVEYVRDIIKYDEGMSLDVLFNNSDYKDANLLILLDKKPEDIYISYLCDLMPEFKDMKFGDTIITKTKYDQTIGILYGENETQLMGLIGEFDFRIFAENLLPISTNYNSKLSGSFVVGLKEPVEHVQGIIIYDQGMSLDVLFNDYDYKNSNLLILLEEKPSEGVINYLNDLIPEFKDMKFGDIIVTTTKYNHAVGIIYGKSESQLMEMIKEFDIESFVVDQLYSNAYSMTTNAVKTRSQKSINNARKAIAALESTAVSWAIGEFSKQVDEIQQSILVNAVQAILNAQANPSQANVNKAKASIDSDLPSEWKNSYSSAVDVVQQALMKEAVDAYDKALQSKSETDIYNAYAKITEIETSTDTSISSWATNLRILLSAIK
jgi:hypothetical protein